MKRTPLKRGTSQLKRSPMKRGTKKLRSKSTSDVSVCKEHIQALLRELAIKRDGGCILRHYGESGACGGYRNDGELVLQAEHLVTRSNSISFGDLNNIVCLCKHHHIQWKPQHSRMYWQLVHTHIGEKRSNWLNKVEADKRTYRYTLYDWQKIEMNLRQQLKK